MIQLGASRPKRNSFLLHGVFFSTGEPKQTLQMVDFERSTLELQLHTGWNDNEVNVTWITWFFVANLQALYFILKWCWCAKDILSSPFLVIPCVRRSLFIEHTDRRQCWLCNRKMPNARQLGGGFEDVLFFTFTWGRFPIWRAYIFTWLVKLPTIENRFENHQWVWNLTNLYYKSIS